MFALTKIDCALAGGPPSLGQSDLYSVLNPTQHPGCLVAGFSTAARETVSGHIASKLALEHFITTVTEILTRRSQGEPEARVVGAMEFAFREANRGVYEFGHQLAAGGRMGASLMGLIIDDGTIAVGKSDSGSVYIVRNGEVVPFFIEDSEATSINSNHVGANSLVNVEMSSLPLQSGDAILAFSRTLDPVEEARLIDSVQAGLIVNGKGLNFGIEHLFPDRGTVPVLLVITVGPEGIYLEEVA